MLYCSKWASVLSSCNDKKKYIYSKQETWNIILWQGGDRSKSRIVQLSLKKELEPLKLLSL